ARLWNKLESTAAEYDAYRQLLEREAGVIGRDMEFCYSPFTLEEALQSSMDEPPATMLVLPNGWVKVAAALPQICADLRHQDLAQAWSAYCGAWRDEAMLVNIRLAMDDDSRHADANKWHRLEVSQV